MTKKEFVKSLARENMIHLPHQVREQLLQPSGRKPWPVNVRLSKWYNALGSSDQARVHELVRYVSRFATFSVFALLDGNWRVDNFDEPGELRLTIKDGDTEYWLNDSDGEECNDWFCTLCPPGGPGEFELNVHSPADDDRDEQNNI